MKTRRLLIGMLTLAAIACTPEQQVVNPELNVDKSEVSVEAKDGKATVNVTSNVEWTASSQADWISIDPSSGKGSEQAVAVKISAEDNPAEQAREATVIISAGELSKTVKVTQKAKEAEQEPEPEEPQPEVSEWSLVGSFNSWDEKGGLSLIVLDENYFVYEGLTVESSVEFKFVKSKSWDGAIGGDGAIDPDTIQNAGGNNITVNKPGTYDVYLAKALDKYYVMTQGKTPADATEPVVDPSTFTWGIMGEFKDNSWSSDIALTKEGEWLVAKNVEFAKFDFKVRANGNWADNSTYGVAPGSPKGKTNSVISVLTSTDSKNNNGANAENITLEGEVGTFDVYFSYEKGEVWVMKPGYKPGEEIPVAKPFTVVAEGVMEANEIIPYNEKCLLIRGKDLLIYRMAYNSDGTFAAAEQKADWSSYVTLWLAKGPGNYLHFGNMYDTWAVYNCGDDASTLPAWDGICDGVNEGVIVGSAGTFWPARTGHPDGILGFLGDGQLLFYKLDDKARLVSKDGAFVHAYTTGFNFAGYSSKTFCYGYDLVCIDNDGKMWLHTWDAATMTYSITPKQIGSGWDKYTHVIPWGKAILARDTDGNLHRYEFNLEDSWDVE